MPSRRHGNGRDSRGARRLRPQDLLVDARNRLAQAIAGAAMSGMSRDDIVDVTDYSPERVLPIRRDAGISRD